MTQEDFKYYYPRLAKKMTVGAIEGITFKQSEYTIIKTTGGFTIFNCEPWEL